MEIESKSLNVKLSFINMKAAIVYFKQKYGKVPTDLRAVTITAPKAAPVPVAVAPAPIQKGEYLDDIPEDILEEYLGETAPTPVPAPVAVVPAPVAEADLNRYVGVIYAAGLFEKNERGYGKNTGIGLGFASIRNKNGLFPCNGQVYTPATTKEKDNKVPVAHSAGEAEELIAEYVYNKYASRGRFLVVMRTVSAISKFRAKHPDANVDVIHLEDVPESLQGDKGKILARMKRFGKLLGLMSKPESVQSYYGMVAEKF